VSRLLDRIRRTLRRSAVSAFAAVLGGILLAGCMISDKPMFPPSSMAQPLKAGRYTTFERDADKFKADEKIEVRLRGDGLYDFINEKGAATPVSFHRLDGNRFVAQAEDKKANGDKGYGYAVFEVAGDTALVFMADCQKQDKARMEALDVEVRRYECKIDRVADPLAFFAGLELGPPTSKIERE
jgi:outer membrane murein-binding lipoprotein Lpp